MSPFRILAAVLAAECARACTAFAVPAQFSDVAPRSAQIDRPVTVPLTFAAGGAPGEDFAHAFLIPDLPYVDTGTTCGFQDDVSSPCTFLGAAPDVVYVYTPPADAVVDIDVCDVAFDAAVHVYAGPELTPVGCNDDACGRGARIAGLELHAGVHYYFVIDGWNGTCGGYRLAILTDPVPCQLDTPPDARYEGEPDCHAGVYDTYNRGCNDYPYAFTTIECGDSTLVVAGTYGTYPYYDEDFRDTDWYQVNLHHSGRLQCSVVGGAPTQLAILDGREGCEGWSTIAGPVLGEACEPVVCDAVLEPGTYFIFVATRWYAGIRCGTRYLLSVRGHRCPPIAVRTATWGEVKQRYR